MVDIKHISTGKTNTQGTAGLPQASSGKPDNEGITKKLTELGQQRSAMREQAETSQLQADNLNKQVTESQNNYNSSKANVSEAKSNASEQGTIAINSENDADKLNLDADLKSASASTKKDDAIKSQVESEAKKMKSQAIILQGKALEAESEKTNSIGKASSEQINADVALGAVVQNRSSVDTSMQAFGSANAQLGGISSQMSSNGSSALGITQALDAASNTPLRYGGGISSGLQSAYGIMRTIGALAVRGISSEWVINKSIQQAIYHLAKLGKSIVDAVRTEEVNQGGINAQQTLFAGLQFDSFLGNSQTSMQIWDGVGKDERADGKAGHDQAKRA